MNRTAGGSRGVPIGNGRAPEAADSGGPSRLPAAVTPRGGRRGLEPAVRGLLVAGTTSDAGKSVVTAGLCRWLAGAA